MNAWLEKLQFLSDTMESTSQPFCAAGRDGSILVFNEAFCRLTGYTREELYDVNWVADLTVPESLENGLKSLDILDRTHQPQRYEKCYLRKDGSVISVELLVDLALDDMGRPLFYYVFITDITDRKQTEESLRLTQLSLDKFSDSAIWLSPAGNVVYVNETACKRLGYTRDELLSMHIWDIDIDRDYLPDLYKVNWDLLKKKGTSKFESRHRTRTGQIFPVEVTASYIRFGDKEYLISFDRDITERKQAEEEIRESEEKFRVLAESSTAAIFVIQGERYVTANQAAANITGYTKDELLKLNIMHIIHPDFKEIVLERSRARQRGEVATPIYETRIVTKSGEVKWIQLSAARILYRGKPAEVATLVDITERKRAEKELKAAKMQAELYLDLMSHDITNMNQVLLGNLEMLEILSESGETDRGLIDNSLKIINRSSRMISDVRKLTQVQTGKVPQRKVDVGEMLEAVKARYSMVPGRLVTITYTPGECCMVQADDLLGDVFDSLVDNAITHSRGSVTIDLAVNRVSFEGHWYCRIIVADTGPGIPDDLKRKIFMTLEEIGAGEKLKRRGFGLFLVRTLTDHYHGKVWVEDRIPGDHTKGAKFVVLLPAVEL